MSAALSVRKGDRESQVRIYVRAMEVRRDANLGSDYVSSKHYCLLSYFTAHFVLPKPPTLLTSRPGLRT